MYTRHITHTLFRLGHRARTSGGLFQESIRLHSNHVPQKHIPQKRATAVDPTANHHQWHNSREENGFFHHRENLFTYACGSMLVAAVVYAIYHLDQRESIVIGNFIPQFHPDTNDREDQTKQGGLTRERLTQESKLFLKKGARNRSSLLRELIVGTALHEINPESQPESGLSLEPIKGTTKARYFTKSEIRPNSMDLEDFIEQGWKEKLAKKPLRGLDTTLALVGMIAGQQDCKFANMVIREVEDHYSVGLIDFEFSGESFFDLKRSKNRYQYLVNKNILIQYIREFSPKKDSLEASEGPAENAKLKLSDDPRALEFIEHALVHSMDEKNIIDLFRKIASKDFVSPTITLLKDLYAKNSGIVTLRDIRYWETELVKWQRGAAKMVEEHDQQVKTSLRP